MDTPLQNGGSERAPETADEDPLLDHHLAEVLEALSGPSDFEAVDPYDGGADAEDAS